jgi:hypothetical protein
MSEDTIVAELRSILKEDYYALSYSGDIVPSEVTEGNYETVNVEEGDARRWVQNIEVITKTPDNRLFSWNYDKGLTEMQEGYSPDELNGVELTEVEALTETIVVTRYVKK